MRISPFKILALSFLCILSCTPKEPAEIAVQSVSLSATRLELTVGEQKALNVTVQPSNATNKTIRWASSRPNVVSVKDGVVEGLSEGNAVITATSADGNCKANCEVVVKNNDVPVTSVALNKTEITLTKGESQTLTATVKPDNATDKTVTWTSSDSKVATVNAGKVTAVSGGTATITAKAGDKTASCTVTVTVPASGISLDQTEISLVKGESRTLVATVKPDDASDKTVTWTSSDPSVASVDQNGKVTAVNCGTATVTAKAGDKTASCAVIVTIPVSSITLDQTSISLFEGETAALTATVKPDDASDRTVTWTSSNTTVATVDNGTVTAVSAGSATITARAGDLSASCSVTVKHDSSGPVIVSFEFTPQTIDVTNSDQTVTFTVHLTDETGVKPAFSISVYDPAHLDATIQYKDFQLTSGDKKDGQYKAAVTIPKGSPAGNWTVAFSGLQDESGNQAFLQKTLVVIYTPGNTEDIVDGGNQGWD